MTTTRIAGIGWAIVWDADAKRHVYKQGIDIVFTGDRITHIGPGYTDKVDKTIDGTGLMVMPGLVDIHSHLLSENVGRGVTEEIGNPALYMSGVADPKPLFLPGHSMDSDTLAAEGLRAATRMAISELLLSATTTVVDLAIPYEGWLDTLADTGIRAVAAPVPPTPTMVTVLMCVLGSKIPLMGFLGSPGPVSCARRRGRLSDSVWRSSPPVR